MLIVLGELNTKIWKKKKLLDNMQDDVENPYENTKSVFGCGRGDGRLRPGVGLSSAQQAIWTVPWNWMKNKTRLEMNMKLLETGGNKHKIQM